MTFEGEKLYHYTTVDTLALILESKKIRFTPLDRLDDMEEYQSQNLLNAGTYFFVSCYSDKEQESIPIWNMYSKNGQGVRIEFQMPIFDQNVPREGKLPLPTKIEYTDDENAIKPKLIIHDATSKILSFATIGTFKRSHWDFQNEVRYIYYFEQKIKQRVVANNYDESTLIEEFKERDDNGIEYKVSYKDLEIRTDALKNIVITLGYNISPGNRLIVQHLSERYNQKNDWNITIKESELSGKVRFKL